MPPSNRPTRPHTADSFDASNPGTGGGAFSIVVRNRQTGTSYAIQSSDLGKLIEIHNSTANTIVTLTIAQAGTAGFTDGWFTTIKNLGSNYATFTPVTSTVETANIMVIPPYACVTVYSDGTNYFIEWPGVQRFTWFTAIGHDNEVTASGAGSTHVDAPNNVFGWIFSLRNPKLLSNSASRVSNSTAAATVAYGMYDGNGNRFFTSGPQSLAVTNTNILLALGSTWLFLPGMYTSAWTASVTTANLYPDSINSVGSSVLTVWGNGSVPFKYFKSSNVAVAGDVPTTLGTLSQAAAILTMNTSLPFILYSN